MPFDTVAIVGVGLIGGSIGLALKERRLVRTVVGIGRSAASLRLAKRRGAIDRGTTQVARGVADADLIVICTPVDSIPDRIVEASASCTSQAILTDTGSTKAQIVYGVERHLRDRRTFVGSHPLAGSEKSGVAASRADLFDGRVCVVTETERTARRPLAIVTQFWRSLGSRVLRMEPEAHDEALAYTSHLPHLVAAALSILLPEEYKEVVATGFRDTTRIAASDPDLWSAIFLDNAEPMLQALGGYERVLGEFRQALKARDGQRIKRLWSRSYAKRRHLDRTGENGEGD
jgi:prephenate dehydrogenase